MKVSEHHESLCTLTIAAKPPPSSSPPRFSLLDNEREGVVRGEVTRRRDSYGMSVIGTRSSTAGTAAASAQGRLTRSCRVSVHLRTASCADTAAGTRPDHKSVP